MMAAAGDRDDINMQALFDAATTVTKLEKPKAWWRPASFGDEGQRSVDWVLLGQLLRRALGWDDYPEAPAG